MYSTTGLAVGMALGFPAFMFIVVIMIFWYRQKLKYKKDLKDHDGIEDYDEINDLDLDHMIDTPKESHIKDFSTDNLVSDEFTNNNKDIKNNNNSNGNYKSDRNSTRHNSMFGANGVVIKNGNYTIRKESKVMGLRMISKDSENLKKNRIISNVSKNNNNLSNSDDANYKLYYESVIPVLPEPNEFNGSVLSTNNDESSLNPPKTPRKHFSSDSNNNNNNSMPNSRSSNLELFKMLQDDSPFYPKSKIAYSNTPDSPFNKSEYHNSASSLADMMKESQQQAEQMFNSPHHSRTNTNTMISPFDTPPSKKYFTKTSTYSINDDDHSSAIDHTSQTIDTDNTKNHSGNIFDKSVNLTDDDNEMENDNNNNNNSDNSDSDEPIDNHDSLNSNDNNSALEDSPLRKNLHRRINSAESRILIDNSNLNTAEESYNLKRKEWLDIYKKR